MTDREKINAAAHDIAHVAGWDVGMDHDFVTASNMNTKELNLGQFKTHARSLEFLKMAEAAFAAITGDSPDYAE